MNIISFEMLNRIIDVFMSHLRHVSLQWSGIYGKIYAGFLKYKESVILVFSFTWNVVHLIFIYLSFL